MNLNTTKVEPGALVLHIEGRLDGETCDRVKQAFRDYAAGGAQHVTVEMSQVSFLDSAGMSALISGLKTMRQKGGGLSLAAVGSQARTALRLTLLDTVLPIYDSVKDAVAAQQARPE
jgi:anti-sigma B factor antagonist